MLQSDATPRWVLLTAFVVLAACTRGPRPEPEVQIQPPAFRPMGERLPGFSGRDPVARGWVKVDDLIWVDAARAVEIEEGFVWNGSRFLPVNEPLRSGPAHRGFRMRTDHVAVLTNVSWNNALRVARVAEDHVVRFFAAYGASLDIRSPQGPLTVVVTSTRAELDELLRDRVPAHVSWSAFYDADEGAVYMSYEPATAGELPWGFDLRHEMTHQILDLARPDWRRGRHFGLGWFWLWEGIAVHSETLGESDADDPRGDRFRKRRAWNQVTPLATLVTLGPTQFEGRHYDQTGVLMQYLLDGPVPALRDATLGLVRDLLGQAVPPNAFQTRFGRSPEALESAWLASLGP